MSQSVRRLEFELTKPQSKAFRIVQNPKVDLNLEWGRGSGKSWFDRFVAWTWVARAKGKERIRLLEELGIADKLTPKTLKLMGRVKGVRIVFLMPTLKQFKDVHGQHFKSEVEDWSHLGPRPNWTDYKIQFGDGSWIMPFPAADHSSQRSRGIRCDVVIADECDDIDPSVFDSVVKPWFSEPWSLKIRITSGTYKRGRHGLLYQRRVLGRDKSEPRYHTIHSTYRDSPEVVDAEEVADAKRTTNPATFAREWECDPDSGEGLVYPFNEDFHIKDVVPKAAEFSRFVVGVDHGWEDPGVHLLIGIQGHGRDAVAWIVGEIYEQHKSSSDWDAYAKQWNYADSFFCDPSRPDRISDLRNKANVNAIAAENDIFGGIARVADMMFIRPGHDEGQPDWCRLYVASWCTNTIREFNTYRRKKNRSEADSFLEKPEDKNNHSMDALKYALVGVFGLGEAHRHETSGR